VSRRTTATHPVDHTPTAAVLAREPGDDLVALEEAGDVENEDDDPERRPDCFDEEKRGVSTVLTGRRGGGALRGCATKAKNVPYGSLRTVAGASRTVQT